MAISDAAASIPEYKAWVKIEDSSKDLIIADDLVMATRWWEEKVGQFFTKDAAAVARVFRAKYTDILYLTDEGLCPGIADTSGMTIKVDTDDDGSFSDETAWATTDYDLEPLQALLGPIQRPYDTIRVKNGGSQNFRPGVLVQVSALWGWPSVPTLVKQGVLEWCAIWRGESIRSTARVNEMNKIQDVSPFHLGMMNKLLSTYNSKVAL